MNAFWLRAALFLMPMAAFDASARAVTYKATLLHPIGFSNSLSGGASGASQVGGAVKEVMGSVFLHAHLWNGTAASAVDLHPVGFLDSNAAGVAGAYQVGSGTFRGNFLPSHALLWNGTAASVVDLHSARFTDSFAYGVSGASQVGVGHGREGEGDTIRSFIHALLWNGTAASVVDLHPAQFDFSEAFGVSGASQVGHGDGHALLWNGTAASVVVLHPEGYLFSKALGVSGASQVGWGSLGFLGPDHALLWNGTAASVVDLNPVGFSGSIAQGVAGASQVGVGYGPATGGNGHALLWNGTAASALDLHPFVTALNPMLIYSYATGIADNGSIVGTASDANLTSYAVLWTPVPEPASCTLVACGIAVVWIARARSRRSH